MWSEPARIETMKHVLRPGRIVNKPQTIQKGRKKRGKKTPKTCRDTEGVYGCDGE